MLVRYFLAWTETASAGQRAAGASALARAYLSNELPPAEKSEALVALTALLDDPSPLVRRALAEIVASSLQAPRHVVAALAADQSDIASIVLARSPLLSDADLIDCAAIGDAFAQSAIAIRPRLSAPVAAALAEVGAPEALIALCVNPGADLPEFSMRRIIERAGDEGDVREALLSRRDLPIAVRHALVVATAAALSTFVTACAWLSETRTRRVTGEARERAIVTMSAGAGQGAARVLAGHLRASGALTAGLILRAVLCGNLVFFEAALVELSQLAPLRVSGLVREFGGTGFAALYKKAGLPPALLPVFRAALATGRDVGEAGAGRLSLPVVERVLAACEAAGDGASHRLLAVLHRFLSEAAREEARELAANMVRTAHGELALSFGSALAAAGGRNAEAAEHAIALYKDCDQRILAAA